MILAMDSDEGVCNDGADDGGNGDDGIMVVPG